MKAEEAGQTYHRVRQLRIDIQRSLLEPPDVRRGFDVRKLSECGDGALA